MGGLGMGMPQVGIRKEILGKGKEEILKRGFLFACTDKSEGECLDRLLFATEKFHGPVWRLSPLRRTSTTPLRRRTREARSRYRRAARQTRCVLPQAAAGPVLTTVPGCRRLRESA